MTMRYGHTPLMNVWHITKDSEIPPEEGVGDLFMAAFMIGDKEYTASLTRTDAATLRDRLTEMLKEY